MPTPTIALPPNMGLTGGISREVARALTAAAPRVPAPVLDAESERLRLREPATPSLPAARQR